MDLRYISLYYTSGNVGAPGRIRHEVTDPPTSGFSRAFLIETDTVSASGKRKANTAATLFCPFTFFSYQLTTRSAEIHHAKDIPLDAEYMIQHLQKQWALFQKLGLPRAYEVAALVMAKLGGHAPLQELTTPDPEKTRKKGGKPINEAKLKPISSNNGQRIKVAKFFDSPSMVSMLEGMAQLGMNRNTVLTHLHRLHTDHGLGYTVQGDCARIEYPEGYQLYKQEQANAIS